MINKLIITLLLFFGVQLIVSCKKKIDSSGSLADKLNSYQQFSEGRVFSETVNGFSYTDSTITAAGIPVILSGTASNDVEVSAEIDTTLCQEINTLYNFHNLTPNRGAFTLKGNGKITVKTGQQQSSDSIYVVLKSATGMVNGGTYLIPLRFKATDNTPLKSDIGFVRMTVTINNYYGRINSATAVTNPSIVLASQSTQSFSKIKYFTLDVEQINTNPIAETFVTIAINPAVPFAKTILYGRIGADNNDSLIRSFTYNFGITAPSSSIPAPVYTPAADISKFTVQMQKLPITSFDIVKDSATIPINGTLSTDNMRVRFSNLEGLTTDSSYAIAVKLIKGIGDKYLLPDPDPINSYLYFKVRVQRFASKNIDNTNSMVAGNLVDRSTWVVSGVAGMNYGTTPPANAFDNNPNTIWRVPYFNLPTLLNIDMAAARTIKGFRILPNYTGTMSEATSQDMRRVEVFSSQDNVTWVSQGYYFGTPVSSSSSIANPDIKYISFVTPVTARYFRLRIVKSSSTFSSTSAAEINAVE